MALKIKEIIDKASTHFTKRFCFFVISLFISAIGFNLLDKPNNIVTGGTSGLSIIVNHLFNIEPSTFIIVASILFIILGFIFLGFNKTIKSIVGALLFPIFIKATSDISTYITLNNISLFLISIYSGVISGITTGIIIKQNFSSGATQIIYQIINKYFKISLGNAIFIANILVISISCIIFGLSTSLYGVISLYISSLITDKIILGISDNKTFLIITSKDKEIKEIITKQLKHNLTIIDTINTHP
ncbi:MAG: YitT family protein, partial [bacterium]|nr:YitT family protein [bacterium]